MADWRSNDYYRTIRTAPVDHKELEYFQSQAATKRWIDSPDYDPVITPARLPRNDGEDEFLGRVLQTDDTIKNWLMLVSKATFPIPGSDTAATHKSPSAGAPDALILFRLEHGVNGFRGIAHGGLLCTLLDETLSSVVELHKHTSGSSRDQLFTVRLTVNFRRLVTTPDTVIAKTWLEKRDHRKWIMRGLLENSEGELCADVDGLWIAARSRKL